MTNEQIREHLLKAGVKNLKEFGYPLVTTETILTDEVYKEFFKSMLEDNLGNSNQIDEVINNLISEIESLKEPSKMNGEIHFLLSPLEEGKEISVEKWLEALKTDSKTLAKNKDKFLDEEIYFTKQLTTTFSGSWSVPNQTNTITYFIGGKIPSKEEIKNSKQKEKEHRKSQNKCQENHNNKYLRPSTTTTEYGTTTLRKVLKKFDERTKSFHGTMSNIIHNYIIKKIS